MKTIIISILLIILPITIKAQNFWQHTEFPSFYTGEIISIDARNNIVIVSSYGDGLAISTDGGENWYPTFTANSYFSSVAVSKSEYLYAIGYDGVLYRSVNKGITWEQSSTNSYGNGPQIISCTNGYLYISSYQGVFRSIDEGVNWTLQNNGLIVGGTSPSSRIRSSGNGILAVATPSGVFKSTNNADSWIKVCPIGAGNVAVNSLGHIFSDRYRESPYLASDTLYRSTDDGYSWTKLDQRCGNLIFINPDDDGIVASLYDNYTHYSFSSDYGITWSNIPVDEPPRCMAYNGNGKYFWGTTSTGIFKSNSLTGPWNRINNFPESKSFVRAILSRPGVLYAGTKMFGLYKSTDSGNSFNKILPGVSSSYSVDKLSSSSNGNLFAISNQGTITRSTDRGKTWSYYSAPGLLYNLVTFSLCTEGSIVLTGGTIPGFGDAQVARSTDNGDSWNEVFSKAGVNSSNPNIEYSVIALVSNQGGTVLGCIENLFIYNPHRTQEHREYSYNMIRSTDYGESWQIINMDLPRINDFGWNSLNDIFAATTEGILKSVNGGISWNYLNTIFSNTNCLVINSKDGIYAGTENQGIYFSTNNGFSWSILNQGITDTTIKALEIGFDGFLYAGTENGGVFRSMETIDSIRYIDTISSAAHLSYPINNSTGVESIVHLKWNSVPYVISYELQVSTDSSFNDPEFHYTDLTDTSILLIDLDYACKYFWRVETAFPVTEKWSERWSFITETVPTQFELYQNYPNPFNPKTYIRFNLPLAEKTTLKVYDILGNEVVILINEEKPAGRYQVEFDGSSFSSGIYLYKLETENILSVKKMILIK